MSMAEDHQADVSIDRGPNGGRCGVWSPDGYWTNVPCTGTTVVTQSQPGNILSMFNFTVPNEAHRTVTYSNDNPPTPGAICYHGGLGMYLPNWKMHVSASGKGFLRCWAP